MLPPFTDIRSVQTLVDADKLDLKYGAQDLSAFDKGAYTGEISGAMLAKLGCDLRRGRAQRAPRVPRARPTRSSTRRSQAAYRHGLTPILCVGEGLEIRQAGTHVAHTLAQLDGALAGIPAAQVASIVVAYEPVWAIGTGEVATPEDAQEVCGAIRTRLGELYSADLADGVRVLYGGSVKAVQRRGDHGQARRRRRPHRRCQPRPRRVRRDRAVPPAPGRRGLIRAATGWREQRRSARRHVS